MGNFKCARRKRTSFRKLKMTSKKLFGKKDDEERSGIGDLFLEICGIPKFIASTGFFSLKKRMSTLVSLKYSTEPTKDDVEQIEQQFSELLSPVY